MGYSPWEMLEDPGFWFSRLHPEDAKRVKDQVFPLLEQGGGTLEYRFRHRGGNYIWVQDTFKVMRDDAGRTLEVVGSWADISNLKQAEQVMSERMAVHARPARARRCQSVGHIHHSDFGQSCVYVRQRQSEIDYGICTLGDARRSEVLGEASPSRGCPAGARRGRQADRHWRRGA